MAKDAPTEHRFIDLSAFSMRLGPPRSRGIGRAPQALPIVLGIIDSRPTA